ncbi:hypothetical protein PENSPDRAFT_647000 [Peniophora sp. CONT]|nr:hypothetical protein PENSPDRAFT_647000 [Peniophora sp. CONT]
MHVFAELQEKMMGVEGERGKDGDDSKKRKGSDDVRAYARCFGPGLDSLDFGFDHHLSSFFVISLGRMSGSYKENKEAFVSDGTGSTLAHINLLSSVAVLSIGLHVVLLKRLPPLGYLLFPVSFVTLVLPILLGTTTLADRPGAFFLYLLAATACIFLLPTRESGTPLPSASPIVPDATFKPHTSGIAPLPALSTYRAHMLLLTALCILAVDFPIFPRMLAKCETYGVSLMDIGVGSFVFSSGLVSARPIVKDPRYLSQPLLPKVLNTLGSCIPVLVLGIIRVLLVKGTEYPEHVTEYGVHWNFFLTLGTLPLLQILLHPILANQTVPIPALGLLLAAAQQLSLSTGSADYILHAPRTTILSANKEGLLSLPGYLALHILGLATGTTTLPPSPSFFRRQQHSLDKRETRKKRDDSDDEQTDDEDETGSNSGAGTGITQVQVHRENDKTATELFSWACVYWFLLGACALFNIDAGVSRRMVNLRYILWVSAYNTTFLLAYLVLDLILFPSPLSKSVYDPNSGLKVHSRAAAFEMARASTKAEGTAPALLDAINRNGLVFFLVANVATGAVNLSMETMYASNGTALAVLGIYSLGICAFAWVFRGRRLL